jgi:hypothetical protein
VPGRIVPRPLRGCETGHLRWDLSLRTNQQSMGYRVSGRIILPAGRIVSFHRVTESVVLSTTFLVRGRIDGVGSVSGTHHTGERKKGMCPTPGAHTLLPHPRMGRNRTQSSPSSPSPATPGNHSIYSPGGWGERSSPPRSTSYCPRAYFRRARAHRRTSGAHAPYPACVVDTVLPRSTRGPQTVCERRVPRPSGRGRFTRLPASPQDAPSASVAHAPPPLPVAPGAPYRCPGASGIVRACSPTHSWLALALTPCLGQAPALRGLRCPST